MFSFVSQILLKLGDNGLSRLSGHIAEVSFGSVLASRSLVTTPITVAMVTVPGDLSSVAATGTTVLGTETTILTYVVRQIFDMA